MALALSTHSMIILPFILISITLSKCLLPNDPNSGMDEMLKLKDKVLKMKSVGEFKKERELRKKEKNILQTAWSYASKIYSYFGGDSDTHEDLILGAGGEGLVFKYETSHQTFAMKYVSFEYYLEKQLQASYSPKCARLIIKELTLVVKFKNNDADESVGFVPDYNLIKDSFPKDRLDTECKPQEIDTITQNFENYINQFFGNLKNEVEINSILSEFSHKEEPVNHRSFYKFERCVVSDGLDYYLVMEELGRNLTEPTKTSLKLEVIDRVRHELLIA
jgi:hypothetical protein